MLNFSTLILDADGCVVQAGQLRGPENGQGVRVIFRQYGDAFAGLQALTPQELAAAQRERSKLAVRDGLVAENPCRFVRLSLRPVQRMQGAYFLPPSLGIGMGKGVTLPALPSVILAMPSFSTSSIRMMACMGMKLR